MSMQILSIRDVHKSYGRGQNRFDAMKRLSFDIRDGESTAIVNRSRRRFRVLICDNDEVYRIGLSSVLTSLPEIVVVGETAEPARALELSEMFAPQIALVSSELGGAALPLVEALNRQGVRIIWLGPQSARETDRTKHPDADARERIPREANSVDVVNRVRAALPT